MVVSAAGVPQNIVTITGNVKHPSLNYVPQAIVRFTLQSSGYTKDSLIVEGNRSAQVVTNNDGSFFIGVWANEDSTVSVPYLVEVIVGKTVLTSFRLYVSSAQQTINLTDAIVASKKYEGS